VSAVTGPAMDRGHADALMKWLYWCEAHPSRWASGTYEIPLHQVGLTSAEVDALFGLPDLVSVRAAVETAASVRQEPAA
jgi:hypothetical protein